MSKSIRTVEVFYAHALAIEREAAERYAEFETYFRDRGEEILAGLCANLSRLEAEHYRQLVAASGHLRLPVIAAGDYRWLEADSPEAAVREVFYRVAKPRHLLEIALNAEHRALGFFNWVARTTVDAKVRSLAAEMAVEEMQHIAWVRHALEYHPGSRDWEQLFA